MTWRRVDCEGVRPHPRSGAAAAVISDTVYVFGGSCVLPSGKRHYFSDLHTLSAQGASAAFRWNCVEGTGTPPCARAGHCTFAVMRKLYIWGGWTEQMGKKIYLDDLFVFDTETNAWKQLATAGQGPKGRVYSASCIHKGRAVIFAGSEGVRPWQYKSDVFVLDPQSNWWSTMQVQGSNNQEERAKVNQQEEKCSRVVPAGRCQAQCCTYSGDIYVFGGTNKKSGLRNHLGDFWKLNVEQNGDEEITWNKLERGEGQGPSPRCSHGMCVMDGGIFVFGGNSSESTNPSTAGRVQSALQSARTALKSRQSSAASSTGRAPIAKNTEEATSSGKQKPPTHDEDNTMKSRREKGCLNKAKGNSTSGWEMPSDFWVYDTTTGMWNCLLNSAQPVSSVSTTINSAGRLDGLGPSGRAGHIMVSLIPYVLVWGGLSTLPLMGDDGSSSATENVYLDDLWVYDTDGWRTKVADTNKGEPAAKRSVLRAPMILGIAKKRFLSNIDKAKESSNKWNAVLEGRAGTPKPESSEPKNESTVDSGTPIQISASEFPSHSSLPVESAASEARERRRRMAEATAGRLDEQTLNTEDNVWMQRAMSEMERSASQLGSRESDTYLASYQKAGSWWPASDKDNSKQQVIYVHATDNMKVDSA